MMKSKSLACSICLETIEDGPTYRCHNCKNVFCMNCGDDVDGKTDMCYFCIMQLSGRELDNKKNS